MVLLSMYPLFTTPDWLGCCDLLALILGLKGHNKPINNTDMKTFKIFILALMMGTLTTTFAQTNEEEVPCNHYAAEAQTFINENYLAKLKKCYGPLVQLELKKIYRGFGTFTGTKSELHLHCETTIVGSLCPDLLASVLAKREADQRKADSIANLTYDPISLDSAWVLLGKVTYDSYFFDVLFTDDKLPKKYHNASTWMENEVEQHLKKFASRTDLDSTGRMREIRKIRSQKFERYKGQGATFATACFFWMDKKGYERKYGDDGFTGGAGEKKTCSGNTGGARRAMPNLDRSFGGRN